ncbi:DUF5448 family protein [Serratia marcescens]|uniref:DUF5448 family protein n=1 Tax=Serratia marcescens TaxID=615 RepID=UPI0028825F8A|nr:DUF5448 family protein [Serratia marcescens]MDT0208065.1 Eaf protein [Serratia marcescens]
MGDSQTVGGDVLGMRNFLGCCGGSDRLGGAEMTEVLTYEALKAERDALEDRVNALAVENQALNNFIATSCYVWAGEDPAWHPAIDHSPETPETNQLNLEESRFLTDAITAAGLLSCGKQDKGLARRITDFCVAKIGNSNPAKLRNDHQLVDLKNDIEREQKRRADGPKVTTYYVVTCITEAEHFADMDCAMRCLQIRTKELQEWMAEDQENRDYVNRCTGIVSVKLQVKEMNLDHFNMRVAENHFDDICYPEAK